MTVREMMRALAKMPADAIVVVASNAEQDNFELAGAVELGYWDQGELFGEFHEESCADDPYFDWQPTEESATAVCITPEG